MSIAARLLGWVGIVGGLVLAFYLSIDAGVTMWWIIGGIGIAAAIGVILSAVMVAIEASSRKRPIDPGTHPTTWPEPIRSAPMLPQTVTTTTNYYIDTVNVYQAAPLEQPQPARVPAEVRRIRPAIERGR